MIKYHIHIDDTSSNRADSDSNMNDGSNREFNYFDENMSDTTQSPLKVHLIHTLSTSSNQKSIFKLLDEQLLKYREELHNESAMIIYGK